MAIDKYRDWDTFVKVIRDEINRFEPPATRAKDKPQPIWEDFVEDLRLRISIDGDDTLTKSIADKDAEIAQLKEKLAEAEAAQERMLDQILDLSESKNKEKIDLDAIYLKQIETAQAFLNDNRKADVSRIKDLFRKMLPQNFHSTIEQLKDSQDPQVVNNYYTSTQVLPNAVKAEQHIHK